VIRRLLLSLAVALAVATPAFADDLIEAATRNGNLGMLMQLIRAAGMTEVLKGPGPFTLFAPDDNHGFMEIEDSSLFEEMLVDRERLARFLSNHIVAGRVLASDLNYRLLATTLPGATLTTVRRPDGRVQVLGQHQGGPRPNGGYIVAADIEATNGVIHVIDSIILPPQQRAF
jgi:uncharacterized surface protein with fasciclin (FAS1) repeats